MKGGRTFMVTKKKAVLSVLVVALLAFSAIPLFSSDSTGLEGYQRAIEYRANNGTQDSRTIIYDGIASTEYNPEYWEGTGDVYINRAPKYMK